MVNAHKQPSLLVFKPPNSTVVVVVVVVAVVICFAGS
jgi:hypothetical protein